MLRFHERTLALLGNEVLPDRRSIESLIEWAKENDLSLPAAYLEWATIDDGSLLEKYSNDDWFCIDDPHLVELVEMPDGEFGLRFNRENQGNFDRIVMLEQGDDPPVLFAWIGRPPWVTYAERFSDAVYAQVFDWQYWLEFDSDDPKYKEIAYTGDISFKTDHCLAMLRGRYEEVVTTRFIVEDEHYTEYRFIRSPTLRLTVTVAEDRSTEVRITGRPLELVQGFAAELRSELVR